MANISTNSQGNTLSAGDGSNTHSGILNVLRAIGYLNLLQSLIQKEIKKKEDEQAPEDNHDKQEAEPVDIDVTWENDTPVQLGGAKQKQQLKGTEQKRLNPSQAAEEAINNPQPPLNPDFSAVSQKENLAVTINIGTYQIEDRYPNLPAHFKAMPRAKQEVLEIAMAGGLPSEPVSIKVKDEFDREFSFDADSTQNQGWKTINENPQTISAQEMQAELIRQNGSGPQKIRDTLTKVREQPARAQTFYFSQYTMAIDGDEVIVRDQQGIIRDAVKLDRIGNQGLDAVSQEASEAIGAFKINNGIGNGAAIRPNKQRELTP